MIITAQLFFNELDLFEIKCAELAGVVDAHVVLEATTTFCGAPKPLHFWENRQRFSGFNVIHQAMEIQSTGSAWDREYFQRQALLALVKSVRPEIVLWVDADELPRADTVARFKASKLKIQTIEMDQLLFFFDRVDPRDTPWTNGKIEFLNPSRSGCPNRVEPAPALPDAGWHFEYFGDRSTLLAKLNATSHAPEPGAVDMRAKVETGQLPGIERTVAYPEEKIPKYVRENRGRFASYFSR